MQVLPSKRARSLSVISSSASSSSIASCGSSSTSPALSDSLPAVPLTATAAVSLSHITTTHTPPTQSPSHLPHTTSPKAHFHSHSSLTQRVLTMLAFNAKLVCALTLSLLLAVRVYTTVQGSLSLRQSLQDLLINAELLPLSPQSLVSDHFARRGREEMRRSDVTVMGVARDVARSLPTLLPQIDALCAEFAYCQAVFVEGDSVDETLAMLREWAERSPHNRTVLSAPSLSPHRHNLTSPSTTTITPSTTAITPSTISTHTQLRSRSDNKNKSKKNALPREARIANARNLALRQLQSLSRPLTKYLVVIDLDIIGFNPLGVWDSLGRSRDWDAVCAQGVLMHGVYRDTYAFRAPGIDTNHHQCGDDHDKYNISERQRQRNRATVEESKRAAKSLMSVSLDESPNLIRVDSCFGGMTIYKMDAIKGCEYSHISAAPPHLVDCEHVNFHQCLRESHNSTRIFSNPNMKLWYGHSSLRNFHFKHLLPAS